MDEKKDLPMDGEAERAARRRRRAELRRRQRALRRRRLAGGLLAAVLVLAALAAWRWRAAGPEEDGETPPKAVSAVPEEPLEPEEAVPAFRPEEDASTVRLTDGVDSAYAVLLDAESGAILAEKDSGAVASPASMTKILTLLVAAERLSDLDAPVTMTAGITDYCYQNDCSSMGLEAGESASVRELLYGMILPSGADASLALANAAAGSQEAFVELMNEKAEELGLSDTAHFTNCVGLYGEDHHCTVRDMAVILRAAMDNALCREVLTAHTYQTAPTGQHPEGIALSNWFLRRIEDKDTGEVEVMGAKTGYVVQSGSCAASWGERDGRRWICVTANASSAWRAIYDHAALYKAYCN